LRSGWDEYFWGESWRPSRDNCHTLPLKQVFVFQNPFGFGADIPPQGPKSSSVGPKGLIPRAFITQTKEVEIPREKKKKPLEFSWELASGKGGKPASPTTPFFQRLNSIPPGCHISPWGCEKWGKSLLRKAVLAVDRNWGRRMAINLYIFFFPGFPTFHQNHS